MFKKLSVLVVLLLSSVAYAEPPQIKVSKDGTTVIKSGPHTVTVLPDGTLKVQSNILNLTLGGDNVSPTVPPDVKPPVANSFQEAFDKDPSDPDAKKATLALFIKIWADAADKINGFSNSAEVNDLVSPQLKALGKPLAGIRNLIADELRKAFPEPIELTPEKKRSLTEKINDIVSKLQGVK